MGLLATIAELFPDVSFEFNYEGGDTVESLVNNTVRIVDDGDRPPIERVDEFRIDPDTVSLPSKSND